MKDALTTTIEYTTSGGRAAIKAINLALPTMEDHAYVVLRRLRNKMEADLATHKDTLEQEARDRLPPPPTVREDRDL